MNPQNTLQELKRITAQNHKGISLFGLQDFRVKTWLLLCVFEFVINLYLIDVVGHEKKHLQCLAWEHGQIGLRIA